MNWPKHWDFDPRVEGKEQIKSESKTNLNVYATCVLIFLQERSQQIFDGL